MSDQEEEFQQRWGFRRNESNLDSSSDDQSGPTRINKHKMIYSEENNQETINIESETEADVHLSSKEANKEPSQSCKEHNSNTKRKGRQRQVRPRKPRKTTANATLNDLSVFTESLIQGIKVARSDLFKWMSKEMRNPIIQDDGISLNPDGKGRGKKRNPRRTKAVRNNPIKDNHITQKQDDDGCSEKLVSKEIVEAIKEIDNVVTCTTTVASNEKQKRKRSSVKKKIVNDQLSSKAAVVALPAPHPTPNYLPLPTVMPRLQVDSCKNNPPRDGPERDFGKRNGVNPGINLTTQLSCFPRTQQKDGIFAQKGMRKVNDYEQNVGNVRVNGNGNECGSESGSGFPFSLQRGSGSGSGFPFSLHPQPQVLNGGIGIQTPNQFGMHFLSQESRMSGHRMNGGNTILSSGNHGFIDNYGPLNQHLRFAAHGCSLGLQPPDIRGTNLPPR